MVSKVGKGWFEWNMGKINVKQDFAKISYYTIGGNNSWFGGWYLDYVALVPCK